MRYCLQHIVPGPVCTVKDLGSRTEDLEHLLRSWDAQSSELPEKYIFNLSEVYSDKNLSVRNLKGHDRHVVAQLQEAIKVTSLNLCLANWTLTVMGEADLDSVHRQEVPGMEEFSTQEMKVTHVADLNGVKKAARLILDDDEVLQEDVFDTWMEESYDDAFYDSSEYMVTYKSHMSVSTESFSVQAFELTRC